MPSFLVLPIALDVIEVKTDLTSDVKNSAIAVSNPLVDFTKLPWEEASESRKHTPFLSETISQGALDNTADTHPLQHGLHFHWSLPTALTKTMSTPIVYKQSFISVFGQERSEDIWERLMQKELLFKFHEQSGSALTTFSKSANLDDFGLDFFGDDWPEIYKLLKGINFPAVPNRWLVSRGEGFASADLTLIESDYLWPEEATHDQSGNLLHPDRYTAFPQFSEDPTKRPYRFLGRSGKPDNLKPSGNEDYLTMPLTAAGYGEPSFAAYYPACRSVFGHHDPNTSVVGESFQVVGWYDDPEQDYFRIFVEDFKREWRRIRKVSRNALSRGNDYLYLDLLADIHSVLRIEVPIDAPEKIKEIISANGENAWAHLELLQWIDTSGKLRPKAYQGNNFIGSEFRQNEKKIRTLLNQRIEETLPEQLVLVGYSRNAEDAESYQAFFKDKEIKVSVGNSPAEALSALIAQELLPLNKEIIEDQLEAIQFDSKLGHTEVDTGAYFQALRHEKQFNALEGGQIWCVKAQAEPSKRVDQIPGKEDEVVLSEDAWQALNALNLFETERHNNTKQIESLRSMIYTDWCWFLKNEHKYRLMIAGSGKGYGNQDIPTYGDQQASDYHLDQVDTNQRNNSGDEATGDMRRFLDKTKEFISSEIKEQLTGLIKKDAELLGLVKENWEFLQYTLLELQQQALTADDINDWSTFFLALNEKKNWVSQEIHAINPATKEECIDGINKILAENDLIYPEDIAKTEEVVALEKALENGVPFLESRKLRFRLNRLSLEAYFPGHFKEHPPFQVQPQAAPRYWRPNDPSVFISGFDPTPRYKNDAGPILSEIVLLEGMPEQKLEYLEPLFATRDQITGKSPGKTNDWHPLFLSWGVAFQQVSIQQGHGEAPAYKPTYHQESFWLANNDFEPKPDISHNAQLGFHGHSILTPGAVLQLKNHLSSRLAASLYDQFYLDTKKNNSGYEWDQFISWLQGTVHISDSDREKIVFDPDRPPKDQIDQWLETELRHQVSHEGELLTYLFGRLNTHPILARFLGKTEKEIKRYAEYFSYAPFMKWAEPRVHIKEEYALKHQKNKSELLNTLLQIDEDETAGKTEKDFFLEWLFEILGQDLDRYFKEHTTETNNGSKEDKIIFLKTHYEEILNWFQPQVAEAIDLIVVLLSYEKLLDIKGLSQSFGGFGEAMIQQRQSYQLPIFHPFPYDGDQEFVKTVREAVLTAGQMAPANDLPFSPWRAGTLRITKIKLIDNFGRSHSVADPGKNDILVPTTSSSLPLSAHGPKGSISLPPRLSQPARLNFRWLSAFTNEEEIGDQATVNPICGWVLPNNLDDSLMIYDQGGEPLGFVERHGGWRPFPGETGLNQYTNIENPHLRDIVTWLIKESQVAENTGFVTQFITTLDVAQENMEPENSASHEDLALLMGRPLALVRADLHISLLGLPVIKLSADIITATVNAYSEHKNKDDTNGSTTPPKRNTMDFENVLLPVRLGEFHRLNDGLVGYWIENNGQLGNQFFAPETTPRAGKLPASIISRHGAVGPDTNEAQFLLQLSIAQDQPTVVSMLIDPRAPVHATTGWLPEKAIQLAPNQYKNAMKNLQIAFLTAPVLSPERGLQLSLPVEPGFEWRWLQKEKQKWSVLSTQGHIARHQLEHITDQPRLWDLLLTAGWLVETEPGIALITPKDKRPDPTPSDSLEGWTDTLDTLLDQLCIRAFDPSPAMGQKYVLKEGWLKLSPEI